MSAFTAAKDFEEKNGGVTGARILCGHKPPRCSARLSYSRLLPKPDSNRQLPRFKRS